MSIKKVVVLGAGLAGLSAAWKLSERGIQVELIEKESAVGGLSRSIRRQGYTFDLGGHRFITDDPNLLNEMQLLLGDDLLIRTRKSIIKLQDKYLRYPLCAKDVIFKINPWFGMSCLLDYLFINFKNKISPVPEISVEDWLIKRFGRSIYNSFFKNYSTKLWGISPAHLSADWAAQRILQLHLWKVLSSILLGKRRSDPRTYASNFYYPRKGIGQIAESMSRTIEKNSGQIRLNSFVKKIHLEGDEVREIIYEQDGKEKIASGDFFVSTIPMNELLKDMVPSINGEYIAIANSMKFRAIKFLNIMLNTEQVSDNTWIYIPEEKFLFFRIQEPKNWNPSNSPEGKTSLTLEIACNEGDAIWGASDEEIYNRCVDDLKKLGLINGVEVDGYFIEKERHGYPVYDLNYSRKIKKIVQRLGEIINLLSIGRQGLFRYNNMDHSIKMGFLAVQHILSGLPKEEVIKIATEQKVFESG